MPSVNSAIEDLPKHDIMGVPFVFYNVNSLFEVMGF